MARAKRRRLVVVSNRGPYRAIGVGSRKRLVRAAGGLVAALDPVLRHRGGVWVSTEAVEPSAIDERLEYDLASVRMSRAEQEGFYQGVSNAVLWPTLHSLPTTIRIGQAPWRSYVAANKAFAKTILDVSQPSDLVWVQDFHLMLVPALLRDARSRMRIGWFCHVPWPSPDLFAVLPWRREIIEGMLGADLLGFHTDTYARNFMDCVERVLPEASVDHAGMLVQCAGRSVRVVVAPIGVAFDEIQTMASDTRVLSEVDKLHHGVNNRRIVLGVDRLDYTKGIPERILAYEQFLRADRSARNRYVFVQVMVPSRVDVRAYAELKSEVDRLIGDINGRYGSTGHVPIHYIYRNLDQYTLYAHYSAADVAFVTPLRDGMNLVAQEYVACRMHNDGVLILSEFAGAADYLHDALLVNPYDIDALTGALQEALAMNDREREHRMHALRVAVHKLEVNRWADNYLTQLEKAG